MHLPFILLTRIESRLLVMLIHTAVGMLLHMCSDRKHKIRLLMQVQFINIVLFMTGTALKKCYMQLLRIEYLYLSIGIY